ncbi:DUF2179 domain-containing protein [Patescibacteria group bacterium]
MLENEIIILWLIPLLIFLSRIVDVSIGTIRIIFISRGWKLISAVLGFIEVFIWILAISQIMKNLDNLWAYFAYAMGFACGTYVGMLIEEKIAVGTVLFHVITKKPAPKLIKELHESDAKLTSVKAKGEDGLVDIIYIVAKRKKAHKVYLLIKKYHPRAFLSVEDIRVVQESLPYIKHSIHHRAEHLSTQAKKN